MYASVKIPRGRIDATTGEYIYCYPLDSNQRNFLKIVILPENIYKITNLIIYEDYKRLGQIITDEIYKNEDLELLNKIRQEYIKYKWDATK